jgi:NAD(P)-dependent dehydrogenase (short-subunit alcohol dehydrogenase family)
LGPRKIRVNAIAPGGVETEGTHSAGIMGSDFEKAMIAGRPHRRRLWSRSRLRPRAFLRLRLNSC